MVCHLVDDCRQALAQLAPGRVEHQETRLPLGKVGCQKVLLSRGAVHGRRFTDQVERVQPIQPGFAHSFMCRFRPGVAAALRPGKADGRG